MFVLGSCLYTCRHAFYVMSSRKATESFYFVQMTQYIYEEDNKSALECLGRQATFKFRALWSVRDSKGLNKLCFDYISPIYFMMLYNTTGMPHLKFEHIPVVTHNETSGLRLFPQVPHYQECHIVSSQIKRILLY